MNGIIFLGCSYTWGQGLYFYSKYDSLKYPKNQHEYNKEDLNDAHIKYKNKERFARKVANYFNTFEVVKDENGGCEDTSFYFLKNLFVNDFVYDDFEYIIIQLSQLYRNEFHYVHNLHKHSRNQFNPSDFATNHVDDNFMAWYNEKNMNVAKLEKIFLQQQIARLKKEITFYESKGLKVKLLTWTEDFVEDIENDLFLKEKFIKLSYKDEIFSSIELLQTKHKKMAIRYDYENLGDKPPVDNHPSLLCHDVIANSIIENLKKENESTRIFPIQRYVESRNEKHI